MISAARPGLAIALYHQPSHVWEIPSKIASWGLDYRLEIRGHGHGSYDTVLYALLHDASEAYLGDLPHPVKHRSEFGALYREIERPLQTAILTRFGLAAAPSALVKEIDRAALAAERALLMRPADDAWWPELDGVVPLEVELVPWSPPQSETEFLARFEALR